MSYSDLECPYCDEEQEVNHDDGYGYEEDQTFEQECEKCGKTFVYSTYISYQHEARKVDCLNGEPHDYQPPTTCPKIATKMMCTMCDDRRQPTPEERVKYQLDEEEV